jgi:hypothetical protein
MTMNWTVPQLPFAQAGYGFRTPFGVLLPPGSQVAAYLRSTGTQAGDDASIAPNLTTTLAQALSRVRSGQGDTILVLPGHSESVVDNTMLNNLVPGTRVIGVGQGGSMPTFRWTATGAQWIMNDADVTFAGLRLRLEGAVVVLAIDVSAADNIITECDIETSSGAANLATVALRASAGATRFLVDSCRVRGVAAGTSTDLILINAAVDAPTLRGIRGLAPSTNGLFRTAAAVTNMLVDNCRYFNTVAGPGGVFGAQATVALVVDTNIGLSSDLVATTAFTQGGGATVRYFNTLFADTTNAYSFGIATGTAST